MKLFQYFGHKPNPDLKSIATHQPIDPKKFDQDNLFTFLSVYRHQIGATMRSSAGLFTPSIYENMHPQHGAFERLLEAIESKPNNRLASITNASYKQNEFIVVAAVEFPQPGGKNVLANIRLGLCKEFVNILKTETPYKVDVTKPVETPPLVAEELLADFFHSLRLEKRYQVIDDGKSYYESFEGYLYEIEITGVAWKHWI